MDSEGDVSCITLAHPDALILCDAMQEGESYYVADVIKFQHQPRLPIFGMDVIDSYMEFEGGPESSVYPAIREVNVRLPPAEVITGWDELSA